MISSSALAAGLALFAPALAAEEPQGVWELLSTRTIGAEAFIETHSEWDGRGVVIAVLDTGVDPGLPGLQDTPAGAAKILDLRDFSGEGDVSLAPSLHQHDEQGEAIYAADGPWLRGLATLSPAPREGSLRVGYLRETELSGSKSRDLDGNGREDDIFGVVVYASEGREGVRRHIVVDTDGDGLLEGEELRADFLEDPRWFTLGRSGLREGRSPLALTLNLWEDDSDKVTFVFDDGAHGSHVAGTAAGHRIGSQAGQHGIAPGAQLISLKLGNNTLSGGSTTTGSMWRAWHYAAEFAAKRGLPLVVQMSFGVGSEDEGQARIEEEIDRLLAENDALVGCVSNGNEGPGLSTAGLPSCSERVIATGAALNRSTAAHLYGVELPTEQVFYFSSRGAEFAKPDILAPGVAASTVPPWRDGKDVMRGTSMAAPQVAGASALLLSAAKAEGLPLVGAWVKQALRRGAKALPGVSVLDQGPGMVDVARAWEIYRVLAGRGHTEPALWKVETISPEMRGGNGPAAHWRGITPPLPPERQEVRVTPVFLSRVSDQERSDFYRGFDLVSTAKWVQPAQKTAYTRSSREMSFDLIYDAGLGQKPGLYTARILAYDKSLSRSERRLLGPDWDLPVSVAVAHAPPPGRELALEVDELAPAAISRHFVRVPFGATGMHLSTRSAGNTQQRLRLFLHDPEGRGDRLSWVGGDGAKVATKYLAARDLAPGTWEIIAYADYENTAPASAEITVRFDAMVLETGIVELRSSEGAPPTGTLSLVNRSRATHRADAGLSLVGHALVSTREGKGRITMPIELGPEIESVEFRVRVAPSDWRRITDLPVRLLDSEGDSVLNGGMGYLSVDESFSHEARETSSYTLEILPAVADPEDGGSFAFTIERRYRYRDVIGIESEDFGDGALVFYPDHPLEVALSCESTPPALPEDANWILELELTDPGDETRTSTIEILAR